jgi:hypothetical protein
MRHFTSLSKPEKNELILRASSQLRISPNLGGKRFLGLLVVE